MIERAAPKENRDTETHHSHREWDLGARGKSVLVIGAGGMAGHVVSTYLEETGAYDLATLSANKRLSDKTVLIDVMNRPSFEAYLNRHSFDVLVNCIGSLIQASEDRKDRAIYLNAYLPLFLEHRYRGSSTKLIHLSTDCVFSGKNPPYREDSSPDGTSFYDRSKYLGEVVNGKDLTFRMSIIGPELQTKGTGLFNWFYAQTGQVSGFTGALWNGVTTVTLARAVHAAIQQDLTGLYHLVPSGNISKFQLLEIFREVFDRDDLTIIPRDTAPTDKSLVNSRPEFNFFVPSYPEQIWDMRSWIERHPELYPHYLPKQEPKAT